MYLVRFFDDGNGCWIGRLADLYLWFRAVCNLLFVHFKLKLTIKVVKSHKFIEFLDVKYRFVGGVLDTDLYTKPTDAHNYLNFNSCHPKSVFSSIIYSQALRYRRIVIDNNTLHFRYLDLSNYFMNCDYPKKLISDILSSIESKPRILTYNNKTSDKPFLVQWIHIYGPGHDELKSYVKKLNAQLSKSETFKSHTNKNIIQVVSKKGANIESVLCKQKQLSQIQMDAEVDTASKCTKRCTPIGTRRAGRKCEGCDLMSEKNSTNVYPNLVFQGGTCVSSKVVYFMACTVCNIGYFGKTRTQLRTRFNGHFTKINTLSSDVEITDENIIAAHAFFKHDVKSREEFNKLYDVYIVEFCHPSKLLIREQFYINKFSTYTPLGLNISSPVGVSGLLSL